MAGDSAANLDSERTARDCITLGPVPPWVRPLEVDMGFDAKESEHFVQLLTSRQVHGELGQVSYRTAIRLKTQQAVQNNSQWPLEFDPRTQRIEFHFFRTHRGGTQIDQLHLANARVLNREQDLERFIIDGRYTWLLLLEDVRAGDILEWSYTTTTRDRLLPAYCYHWFVLSTTLPSARNYCSVLFSPNRALKWKASSRDLGPTEESLGELTLWKWDRLNLPCVKQEINTPANHIGYAWVQVSDCPNWNTVASALSKVFQADDAPLLDEIAAGTGALNEPLATRVAKAIDFVQGECRYLSLDFGLGGHVPAPSGQVARRRYGDCKDLSLLLVQLLKRLNVTARPLLVHANLRGSIAGMLPSPQLFNHAIVEFQLDGHRVWVDPTLQGQGGGALSRFVPNYASALPVEDIAEGLILPPASRNHDCLFDLKESILLDTAGGASVLGVVLTARGVYADSLRKQIALQGIESYGKDRLQHCADRFGKAGRMGTLQVRDDRENNEFCLAETYEITGFLRPHSQPGYCTFPLHPVYNPCTPPIPPETPRTTPFNLAHPCQVSYTIDVESPQLTSAPAAPRSRWESKYMRYSGIARSSNGSWQMTTTLSTAAEEIAPEHLDAHRKLTEAIWRDAGRTLIAPTGYARPRRARLLGQLPAPRKGGFANATPPPKAKPAVKPPEPKREENSAAPPPIPAQTTPAAVITPSEAETQFVVGRANDSTLEPADISPKPPESTSPDTRPRRKRRSRRIGTWTILAILVIGGFIGLMALAIIVEGVTRHSPQAASRTTSDADSAARLRQAAERGDAKSQDAYAYHLMRGQGVNPNPAEAIEWFRKSAAQGYANAQYNLGVAYDEGTGVARDPSEAARLYRLAAEQGMAPAQLNLGRSYMFGNGVEKNEEEGAKWYQKAADQGLAIAQFRIGMAYIMGTGKTNDDVQALKWLRQAADQGHPEAQYNLAVSYAKGRGTPKDLIESYAWLKLSSRANTNITRMLDQLDLELSTQESIAAKNRAEELQNQVEARRRVNP
ncbi:MAG TPA: DUF3857 domain-containing protein [Candidatus Limnocylindria bacterium]|nr:DUF3857 domain-containing protein [Candidatus Limnocylindria bacterium]